MRGVLKWPLREVLLRYVHMIREEALEAYRVDLLVWAAKSAFGGGKPPKVPELLR